MPNFVSCCSPAAFHICPDERIAAGIEASTMTSDGAWRFVMPLSESTIAIAGPAASARRENDEERDDLELVAAAELACQRVCAARLKEGLHRALLARACDRRDGG